MLQKYLSLFYAKIVISILIAFIFSHILTRTIFIANTPIVRDTLGSDMRQAPFKISTFLSQVVTQIPRSSTTNTNPTNQNNPLPTNQNQTPSYFSTPTPSTSLRASPTPTTYRTNTPTPINSGSNPTPTTISAPTGIPTMTPTPTITPTPSPSPTPMHPQALEYFNSIRRGRGLSELYENNNFSIAAQKHAHYMSVNHELTHVEDQSKPGYTQEGARSAQNSNLCSFVSDINRCMDSLMADPPHEQFMVAPNLKFTGFGFEGGYGVVDVLSH